MTGETENLFLPPSGNCKLRLGGKHGKETNCPFPRHSPGRVHGPEQQTLKSAGTNGFPSNPDTQSIHPPYFPRKATGE